MSHIHCRQQKGSNAVRARKELFRAVLLVSCLIKGSVELLLSVLRLDRAHFRGWCHSELKSQSVPPCRSCFFVSRPAVRAWGRRTSMSSHRAARCELLRAYKDVIRGRIRDALRHKRDVRADRARVALERLGGGRFVRANLGHTVDSLGLFGLGNGLSVRPQRCRG